jgi:hypothetical protein
VKKGRKPALACVVRVGRYARLQHRPGSRKPRPRVLPQAPMALRPRRMLPSARTCGGLLPLTTCRGRGRLRQGHHLPRLRPGRAEPLSRPGCEWLFLVVCEMGARRLR